VITYEVTAVVDSRLVAAYEDFMRRTHIPEVLATGCFVGAVFERVEDTQFRTRYQAATQAGLNAYLGEHTARLREEFTRRFPQGVTLSRAVWTELERWRAGAGAP
jgi:hypothetical protein